MQQRYVSNELTHFVGRTRDDEGRYALLVHVLTSGWLTHPPHTHEETAESHELAVNPTVDFAGNEMFSPRVVCFCDIPLSDLPIHMRKYGPFGLAFLKSFLITKGANPVFYVATDSYWFEGGHQKTRADYFNERLKDADATWKRVVMRKEEASEQYGVEFRVELDGTPIFRYRSKEELQEWRKVWQECDSVLRMFGFLHDTFSFVKAFDSGKDDDHAENFYMEREWRVWGNVSFELGDVRRVILPEAYASRFRQDIPNYLGQVHFAETR